MAGDRVSYDRQNWLSGRPGEWCESCNTRPRYRMHLSLSLSFSLFLSLSLQGIGLRGTQPGVRVPSYLPCSQASETEWYYSGQCLYHDRKSRYFPDLPSLSDLSPGQRVGVLVTLSGGLHLYVDGVHCGEIATGLPVATLLWGAADVYGTCTKIKSEILSGE